MKRKAFISEADVASLSKRYSPNTLLTLLQEISSCESAILNWETLVKRSNTGIKSAREYQALWRHLAYRTDLGEHFEDAQPLDDDSDLEFEVEPFPCVSRETVAEAENVVRVNLNHFFSLLALDAPNCGTGRKENRLGTGSWDAGTISQHYGTNGPNSNLLGMNPPSASPLDSIYKAGSTGLVHSERRKRKLWTPEEDQELIAAVEEYGEGNWTNILKSAFRHDRTASQLSQRWALIRKRRDGQSANLNMGPGKFSITQGNEEAQVEAATKSAATVGVPVPNLSSTRTGTSMALQRKSHNQGVARNSASLSKTVKTVSVGPTRSSNIKTANLGSGAMGGRLIAPGAVVMSAAAAQAASIGGSEMWQAATMPASVMSSSVAGTGKLSSTSSWNNTVASGGRGNLKPPVGPDPMVQAAAVAAGARIAPASAAASLLKAAHSGNVVHIRPGVPLAKSGLSSQALSSTRMSTSMNAARGPSGAVVHYIRTGSGALPPIIPTIAMTAAKSGLQQSKHQLGKSSGSVQASHPVPRAGMQMAPPQASSSPSNVHTSSQVQTPIMQFKSPAQTSASVPAIKSRAMSQSSSTSEGSSNLIAGLVDAVASCTETCNMSSMTTTNFTVSASSTSLASFASDPSQVSEVISENLDLSNAVPTSLPSYSLAENARGSISSPISKETAQTVSLVLPIPCSSSMEEKMEEPCTLLSLESTEDGPSANLIPLSTNDGISSIVHADKPEKEVMICRDKFR
ncbi:hypothetical protein O6H91_06G116800 [Diphasiastrum complanatum]|uniref:Uncharacterized protein n=2 Tax=Diphasiastrum complanatum TaxID=34168 RepID=A0ACC2DI63_DIPCM|nr:hypothetical protein O6H91_06G116100 [Diphasiastrum complanatum]KAJ7553884.1 hypothetical protein O6H91_06G116800 [Diphasiastrum complanatum]